MYTNFSLFYSFLLCSISNNLFFYQLILERLSIYSTFRIHEQHFLFIIIPCSTISFPFSNVSSLLLASLSFSASLYKNFLLTLILHLNIYLYTITLAETQTGSLLYSLSSCTCLSISPFLPSLFLCHTISSFYSPSQATYKFTSLRLHMREQSNKFLFNSFPSTFPSLLLFLI